MFLRRHCNVRGNAKLIHSPKCRHAIPIASVVHKDLLIQSTLDPHVRSIEFIEEIDNGNSFATPRSIVLSRDDGRFMIDLVEVRSERDPDHEDALLFGLRSCGISILAISVEDIRREPRFTNCRQIWRHCLFDPAVRDRNWILDSLSEDGPQTIFELERILTTAFDTEATLCALACADLIEIDIDTRQLGPGTIVRSRR